MGMCMGIVLGMAMGMVGSNGWQQMMHGNIYDMVAMDCNRRSMGISIVWWPWMVADVAAYALCLVAIGMSVVWWQ